MTNPFEGWKPGEFYGEIVDGKGYMAAKFLDGCDAVSFLDMAKAFEGMKVALKSIQDDFVPSNEGEYSIALSEIRDCAGAALEAAEKIGE